MTSGITRVLAMPVLFSALLIVACSDPPSPNSETGAANGGMPGMRNMTQSPQQPAHTAQGTVNSIDQAAGTVNISHGAVASANWPAMTMSFKLANPSSASGIEPGQRVDFKFTIAGGMDATVTEIKRVE
jgi:Cu(I)/Ag(I) efflux system periplasmic protein CusF